MPILGEVRSLKHISLASRSMNPIIIDAGHTGRFFAVCDRLATLKSRKLGSFLPCGARADRLHIGAHIPELLEAETRLLCDDPFFVQLLAAVFKKVEKD